MVTIVYYAEHRSIPVVLHYLTYNTESSQLYFPVCRSLDKMTSYRSHIRPVVRGQARGWTGYLSSSLPKRGSGANLMQMGVAAAVARDKPTSSLFAGDKVAMFCIIFG